MIPASPNIVVIRTDDMATRDLYALRPDGTPVMPNLLNLIANQGVTFSNFIISDSVCLPSRAAVMTGQYAIHNGIHANTQYADFDPANKLPAWMQAAGYTTAHVGKWLNGYTSSMGVMPNWDYWFSTVDQAYVSFDANDDGFEVHFATAYHTDVMTQKAVRFIRGRTGPYFLLLDYIACHQQDPALPSTGNMPVPALRHLGLMDAHVFGCSPAFDEDDVTDKPAWVQAIPHLSDAKKDKMAERQKRRLETLMAVDEGIARIMATVDLANTVVIFTSDNGWMYGEHRLDGKEVPYEESITVPLIVRAPGVPPAVCAAVVVNVDIAPTVMALAGATTTTSIDGLSFLPLLDHPSGALPRDGVLLESDQVALFYSGVRSAAYAYVEYTSGELELYDLALDPWQLQSQHANPDYGSVIDALHLELVGLMN